MTENKPMSVPVQLTTLLFAGIVIIGEMIINAPASGLLYGITVGVAIVAVAMTFDYAFKPHIFDWSRHWSRNWSWSK